MINLILAILAGAVSLVGTAFAFGGGEFEFWYGLAPGIIALVAMYVVLARKTMKEVEAIMNSAQDQLKAQKIDAAVETIKGAYPLGKRQFLVASQVDAQIGSIYFMTKKFEKAEPYLKRSFKRNWTAQAMLAVLYYKRKKFDDMREVFEEAVKLSKKQAILWNLYAYCEWKGGNREDAINILTRAQEHIPKDEKTKNNLKALQNKKKMKMRGWNMLWYQFHLDKPPAQRQQVKFGRR